MGVASDARDGPPILRRVVSGCNSKAPEVDRCADMDTMGHTPLPGVGRIYRDKLTMIEEDDSKLLAREPPLARKRGVLQRGSAAELSSSAVSTFT